MKKIISLFILVAMLLMCAVVPASAETVTAQDTGKNSYLNVKFSNGYIGFCIDANKHYALDGDVFTVSDTKVATSNIDNSEIANKIKVMFVEGFDLLFERQVNGDGEVSYAIPSLDANAALTVIWNMSDNRYLNPTEKTIALKQVIDNNPNMVIPDSGYKLVLENGDTVVFDFIVLIPQTNKDGASISESTQYFFAYKLTVNPETGDDGNDQEHICTTTPVDGKEPTCTEDGYKSYFECEDTSCDKYYEDYEAEKPIDNIEEWKKNDGKRPAGHDYGELIPKKPPVHTADNLIPGVDEHYYCEDCDTYFDSNKNPTTIDELTGETPKHDFEDEDGDPWEYDDDGHWKNCDCGADTEEVPHIYDNEKDTDCNDCGYVRTLPDDGGNTPGGNTPDTPVNPGPGGSNNPQPQPVNKPEIIVQPKDEHVVEGQDSEFNVVAKGDDITYQWYEDDGDGWDELEYEEYPTLKLPDPDKGDNGNRYKCVVTDKYGNTVETIVVVLHVSPAPVMPDTGDSAMPVLWLAMSIVSFACVCFMRKKARV